MSVYFIQNWDGMGNTGMELWNGAWMEQKKSCIAKRMKLFIGENFTPYCIAMSTDA